MKAFKLVTGLDKTSHVIRGSVTLDRRASPPASSLDWHEAPERQYVITLSGTIEFTTRGGETFVMGPGDVLMADDITGSSHKWRLIDEDPWRRCYVILASGAVDQFVPES
jgi:quercetin dioxygenase-like cupin family protein